MRKAEASCRRWGGCWVWRARHGARRGKAESARREGEGERASREAGTGRVDEASAVKVREVQERVRTTARRRKSWAS